MDEARASEDRVHVVLIEDDPKLARLVASYLETHGVAVTVAGDGPSGIAEVKRVAPDVILLDVMLPGLSGLDVCRRLRETLDTPIILLTALSEEADRVIGLEGGADDYVAKPFSSRELLARVRAQVRRARGRVARDPVLRVGLLVVDVSSMSASYDGRALALTTYELNLLRAFAERPGRVLARERLVEIVRGDAAEAFDRSIDVHISRLRSKLGDDPRNPRILKTVRGAGYVLTDDSRG